MITQLKFVGIPTTDQDRAIALETRRHRPIPNSQQLEPGAYELRILGLVSGMHANWIVRKLPCGIYNCAGHVWASRRTSVYDSETKYDDILHDDGYRKLLLGAPVRLGDVAVYRLIDSADRIIHVGVVAELRTVGSVQVPWLLSKWSDMSGEWLHHFEDVSFDHQFSRDTYDIEFWSDI